MLVSVIVTSWNTAPYIDDCLDSICASTHEQLEVVLVDDGSTDGTRDFGERWSERDSRIRFEALPSRIGRNGALRAAHGAATGSLVCWVDSDDLVHPDGIARCVEVIDDEHEVATTLRNMIDADGNHLGLDQQFNGPAPRWGTHFWHHLRMFTADLFDRAGGVGDLDGSIDLDMNVRFSEHTKAVFIREPLYSQRQRPGRMTNGVAQSRGLHQAFANAAARRLSRAEGT